MPDESGDTRRVRNQRFGMGHMNPAVFVNDQYQYLLDWFFELNAARSMGFNGPNPISYSEIAAWSSMTGAKPSADEIAILRQIDVAYIAAVADEAKPAKSEVK